MGTIGGLGVGDALTQEETVWDKSLPEKLGTPWKGDASITSNILVRAPIWASQDCKSGTSHLGTNSHEHSEARLVKKEKAPKQ